LESNIKLLEELTKRLPELTELSFSGIGDGLVSYEMDCGESTASNLMNVENISIADCRLSENSILKRHSHEEKEWFLVYNGVIDVAIDGVSPDDIKRLMGNGDHFTLSVGDFIFIPSRVPHTLSSVGGAKFIAITIPSSAVFPTNG